MIDKNDKEAHAVWLAAHSPGMRQNIRMLNGPKRSNGFKAIRPTS